MYGFNGDFRTKPIVSLRGASKKEAKEALLQRNHEERKRREESRRKVQSALKIQSFVRGCLRRNQLRQEARSQFDVCIRQLQKKNVNGDSLVLLLKKLLFFYKQKCDGNRLVAFCQILLKHQAVYFKLLAVNYHSWLFDTKRLLLLCVRYVGNPQFSMLPVAMPLRILEVFTDVNIYIKEVSLTANTVSSVTVGCTSDMIERTSSDFMKLFTCQIFQYLIKNNYYEHLRELLHCRVPPVIEPSANPPTPLANTIFDMIMRPLNSNIDLGRSTSFRRLALFSLCNSLLRPAFTEQIAHFILPALCDKSTEFPVVELFESLLPTDLMDMNQECHTSHIEVETSPWLLYSILSFGKPIVSQLDTKSLQTYLHIIKVLLPSLPSISDKYSNDEDDDSDDELMITETGGFTTLPALREKCLNLLNTEEHIASILKISGEQGSIQLLTDLCVLCHQLIVRHRQHVPRTKLLYKLALDSKFLRQLWFSLVSLSAISTIGSSTPLIQLLSRGIKLSFEDVERIVTMLSVFCSLFGHALLSVHDKEFHANQTGYSLMPFNLPELVNMSLILRDACLGMIELALPESHVGLGENYSKAMASIGRIHTSYAPDQVAQWMHVFKVASHLVKQLHSRDIRKTFCPADHWLAKHIHILDDKVMSRIANYSNVGRLRFLQSHMAMDDDGPPLSVQEARKLTILAELPFVIPFTERVLILHDLIKQDKNEFQGDMSRYLSGHSIDTTIRRDFIYEDAYDRLRPENEPSLKKRMRVVIRNAQGLNEAGIDGGGIFREFLAQLLKTAFDPNRGFFKTTTDQMLYPNAQAVLLHEDYKKHYYFMGRMLGKALYENMLVEIPFASFFLSKILTRHTGDVDIHHLASLDPLMYKNLLYLRDYDGDVSSLYLNFVVTDSQMGETQNHELIAGGKDIAVTNNNRLDYIYKMADYRLNKQIRPHIMAFREGMSEVINLEWLRMFDHHELQVLISGASIPIDIDDLKHNTNYSGGYNNEHPVIVSFWKIVSSLTEAQLSALLKFVTSCSRPPLLGFKELVPKFCVHYGGAEERLPTASTCMNLLKLPEFKSEEIMREKLVYAIESDAGFELS
ncbi:ubiquitin-protein ligase E3C-like isoform X2 [Antedon mediterranea]|uniref:ubiquitin-protein ligase E3C-like isoform X2 n=1 Tax=Antedon mediterranea TaxID=105859 RepID=UPI003AF6617B